MQEQDQEQDQEQEQDHKVTGAGKIDGKGTRTRTGNSFYQI